jgi:hypothetical protein
MRISCHLHDMIAPTGRARKRLQYRPRRFRTADAGETHRNGIRIPMKSHRVSGDSRRFIYEGSRGKASRDR